ncbi:GDNF family receptor alpha-2 [Channa argus]|uniref:GDNF family receptor alpha-2 n=1 Tax=Channa argus TaxID=215402 RepID=A0A6G1QHT5_CHAAH|nr:GDNF family receptor alpha-2 [Channa argus]
MRSLAVTRGRTECGGFAVICTGTGLSCPWRESCTRGQAAGSSISHGQLSAWPADFFTSALSSWWDQSTLTGRPEKWLCPLLLLLLLPWILKSATSTTQRAQSAVSDINLSVEKQEQYNFRCRTSSVPPVVSVHIWEEFYETSPYEPIHFSEEFRHASIISELCGVDTLTLRCVIRSHCSCSAPSTDEPSCPSPGCDWSVKVADVISDLSLSKMSPCSEAGKPCNPCLDAAKACNLNETCKRLRSAYNSICSKATPPQPSLANQEPCSRKRCQKALRQFFERVPWELSYPLLFCFCPDQACAERRRRTIVPSCSHQERHRPSCLELRHACRSDALCRTHLADVKIYGRLLLFDPHQAENCSTNVGGMYANTQGCALSCAELNCLPKPGSSSRAVFLRHGSQSSAGIAPLLVSSSDKWRSEADAGGAGDKVRAEAQCFNVNLKPLDQMLPELPHLPMVLVKVSSKLIIKSRLADFHMNCQMTPHTVTSCPHDNYHGCLMSYVGLIGSDVTPNYSDSSPSNITISLWCSCRGTGSQERQCDTFHRDFTHNTCLKNAIQSFSYGSEGGTLFVTEPSSTILPPAQPPSIPKPAPSLHGNAIKPMDSACMFSTCANLQDGGQKCVPSDEYECEEEHCAMRYKPFIAANAAVAPCSPSNPQLFSARLVYRAATPIITLKAVEIAADPVIAGGGLAQWIHQQPEQDES